jgi:NADH:ubiquinone reductase (H+-translocating)
MVKVVKARLRGAPLPKFKYRDLGSLVALANYNTFGVVLNDFRLEGLFARLAYRSLHQMHLRALHGNFKVALDTLARTITRRTEPRVKLH